LCEPAHDVPSRVADRGRDLDRRLHELGRHSRLELVPTDRLEHGVDVLDEIERLSVEKLVLLLDSQRVRIALPEGVIEDAAGVDTGLAGDRRGNRLSLIHEITASTSISSFQAGSTSFASTVAFTGRISRNTSPWARATSWKCDGSVRKMRVRTTS